MTVADMRELARSISTGSDSQELDFGLDEEEPGQDSDTPDSPSHESDAPENVESQEPTPSTSKGKGKGKGKGQKQRQLTQLEKVNLKLTRLYRDNNSISIFPSESRSSYKPRRRIVVQRGNGKARRSKQDHAGPGG